MKHVSLDSLQTTMTKREKLLHWAQIIRAHHGRLQLYHNLEHWDRSSLEMPVNNLRTGCDCSECNPVTALSLAVNAPSFQAMGVGRSFASALGFFELTQHELHEFSCDCGGEISNEDQARRIEGIADRHV